MDEAIVEHKLAQKLDPFDASYAALTGALYCFDGQYEKALEEANSSFELQKDHFYGYWVLGYTYLKMGKTDEAIEAHKKLAEIHPWWTSALGYTYAVTGHTDEARKILEDLESSKTTPFIAWQCATVNAGLGNKDEAFKWMNYEPHHSFHAWCAVLPAFESLHDDPRFELFLERLNLPD